MFNWEPQPAGAAWIATQLQRMQTLHPAVQSFQQLLAVETGTRLTDWVDHLVISDITGIQQAGYVGHADGWYTHPGALLPPVKSGVREQLLLRVDSVSDFAVMNSHRYSLQLTGTAGDPLRTALIQDPSARVDFGVIEHRGCNIRQPAPTLNDQQLGQLQRVREQLRLRPRNFVSDDRAFTSTRQLLTDAIAAVGRDTACDLFFEGERAYWQGRNTAARIQYMRQSALGLGWGNHDHHTYRSSRLCFSRLIELFELLGFECREQFSPGHGAGWGAQVLEHPVCGTVIFADVDLTPEELAGDFAHQPLEPSSRLGTIGLWCGLHGEALFEAGMHHLECQFDFAEARSQLSSLGIDSMRPFTDFAFLKQCFTAGERWSVRPERVEELLKGAWITQEQADTFLRDGALGSHLEILERNDGYRGFNQTGISEIIHRTDPRFQHGQPAVTAPTTHQS